MIWDDFKTYVAPGDLVSVGEKFAIVLDYPEKEDLTPWHITIKVFTIPAGFGHIELIGLFNGTVSGEAIISSGHNENYVDHSFGVFTVEMKFSNTNS